MKEIIGFLASEWRSTGSRTKRRLMLIISAFAIPVVFYLAFVHYIEPHQGAIVWNWASGELRMETKAGWRVTWPWVSVARIDLRPQRVCITSATQAVSCNLVHFEPKTYREFVATEGFRYYWLANRISFNWGYDEEYRGFRDILRGYTFSTKKYPFIAIVQEYRE